MFLMDVNVLVYAHREDTCARQGIHPVRTILYWKMRWRLRNVNP